VHIIEEHHPEEPVWVERAGEGGSAESDNVAGAFLSREGIVGVTFQHNDFCEIVGGPHAGERGSLVTVLRLLPEVVYVVETERSGDVNVAQDDLRVAHA